jgi:hypothetical protein
MLERPYRSREKIDEPGMAYNACCGRLRTAIVVRIALWTAVVDRELVEAWWTLKLPILTVASVLFLNQRCWES